MRVFLRALNISDSERIYKWFLDDEIQSLIGTNHFFASEDYVRKWVEEKIFEKKDIYLAICHSRDNEIIGYLSIKDIDFRNSKATWGGILIGDKELWNKGIATEAAILMLKYVFEELNLNLFWGFWLEENIASIKMSEKLGFTKVGILPQSIFKKSRFHSLLIMYMLKDEYILKKGKYEQLYG
jgi:[ribosomal protein S5]-alanine N-acetyltransferase